MGSVYRPTRRDPETGKRVKYHTYRIAYLDEHGARKTEKAFRDKAASEALLRRREADVERKKAGLSVVSDADRQRPIAECVDAYAAELTRRQRTARHIHKAVNAVRSCAAFLKWTAIGQIRADGLRRYLSDRSAQGRAPRTVNLDRDYWCAFVDWLVSQEWLAENPLRKIARSPDQGKHRRYVRRAFTPQEVRRLIATCPPRRAAAYRLAATSGLRRIELRRLERRDADLQRQLWTLRPEVSKNGIAWKVPMSAEAHGLLSTLPDGGRTDRLVTVPTGRSFIKDLKAAGIQKRDEEGRVADFHSFRYFFCSQLARSLPIQKVRVLMRHLTIKQTCDLYLQLGLDDLAEDVWSLPPLLAGEPPQEPPARSHGRKPE